MSANQAARVVDLPPYASIVVGTDLTPCSAVAVGQALRIASWSGALLHVVHVIDSGRIDLQPFVTHRFPLARIEEAYELFANQRDGVVKVAITP